MRKLIFLVLILFILTGTIFADEIYNEMKSMIETLDSSVVLLNKRIDIVIGYFEGKFTDLQSDVDDKIENLKEILEYHAEVLSVIRKTLESVNSTMEKIYENQQVLFKYTDSLSKNQEEIQKVALGNSERVIELEKKQKGTEYLVYLSIALSALNMLLLLVAFVLK